ncbi:MAG: UDP-N-acetylmuramoyl-L-alanine--D-glutamate ligase [bacterium]|nr:UDP-N-acetylmuramoyl-L-alanine--D-glutamate ligase [bacterium]
MILILGLGSYPQGSGTSAALFLAKQGHELVVTDLKTANQLHQPTLRKLKAFSNVTLVLRKHRKQDIKRAKLIVRNPGVPDWSPFIEYAHQLKKPITNDVGLFLDALRERYSHAEVPVIGITGTRGKSTTTAIMGDVFKTHFGEQTIHVGGNIGKSPLTFLHHIKSRHIVILELSSWLLHDLHKPRFTVTVMTNLLRDHMNYYPSMTLYRKDKERIFLGQTADEYAIVNQDDVIVQKMAKHTKASVISFQKERVAGMKLLGEHNQYNIGAAIEVAKLFNIPTTTIERVIKNFSGIANRLEQIRVYKKREFYNDTTATTPDATIAALRSFKKKVILIAGGNTKRLSLKDLNKEIVGGVKSLILLPGNATNQFPAGIEVATMKQAVHTAWNLSKQGDIILLSPGVTWLPKMNEFERGKLFVREVKRLK